MAPTLHFLHSTWSISCDSQRPRTHWSLNTGALYPSPAVPKTPQRFLSPRYYTAAHKKGDKELQREFRGLLTHLRKKQKEEYWERMWNLHKTFRLEHKRFVEDESHALAVTNDQVVQQNIRDKFSHLRYERIKQYLLEKSCLKKGRTERAIEEQDLRDKYYGLSKDLRNQAKSGLHLEIFEKLLVREVRVKPWFTDQGSLDSAVDPALFLAPDVDQQIEPVEQKPGTGQRNQLDSSELEKQPTINQRGEVILLEGLVEEAASITSKISAASKFSSSSTISKRQARKSTRSTNSIRLRETPLLTKPPTNTSVTNEHPALLATPDPVAVERNFLGKIISVAHRF